jgi:hypothetical protein
MRARRHAERSDQARVLAGIVALVPDRAPFAVRPRHERDGKAIAEPAHARHGPEIMIEAAIFLHQHDDVGNVAQSAGATIRTYRSGPRQCRGYGRERCPFERAAQKRTAIKHGQVPSPTGRTGS